MTSPIDLDIFRISRPWSDYDFDVFAGGEWIASAKNYHGGDDVAAEIWYRAMFDQPVIADAPSGNTDRNGDGDVNWNSADPPIDPLPNDFPGTDDENGTPQPRGFAFTRQSLAIEAAMRRCHNCGADHRTWQCPEIHAALFAPASRAELLAA